MVKGKVYLWRHLPNRLFKEVKDSYKDRLGDYYNVYIFDNREDMYKGVEKIEKTTIDRDYGARTLCFQLNYYDVKTNELVKRGNLHGNLYFDNEHLTFSHIAHECSHAIIGYFGRELHEYMENINNYDYFKDSLDDDSDISEELYCYMVGNVSDKVLCMAFPE